MGKKFLNFSVGNPFSHKILLHLAHKKVNGKAVWNFNVINGNWISHLKDHHGLEILYEIQSGQVLVFTSKKITALCNNLLKILKTRFFIKFINSYWRKMYAIYDIYEIKNNLFSIFYFFILIFTCFVSRDIFFFANTILHVDLRFYSNLKIFQFENLIWKSQCWILSGSLGWGAPSEWIFWYF